MAEQSRNLTAPTAMEPSATAKTAATGAKAPVTRATLVDAKLNLAGEDRRQLIAEAAYYRAEQRGFRPGAELDDWLAAEVEIDAMLDAGDTES